MKRIFLPLLVVPLALPHSVEAEMPMENRFAPLAQSMIEMMNAMGSAMSQYGAKGMETMSGGMSAGGASPGGIVPPPPVEWMPPVSKLPSLTAPDPMAMFMGGDGALNGSWIGQYGELLIVSGNRFRIYTSRENFKDGQLRIEQGHLSMSDPVSGGVRSFEYAQNEGRLALRSPDGNLLLFRKVSDQQKFAPDAP